MGIDHGCLVFEHINQLGHLPEIELPVMMIAHFIVDPA